MISGVPFAPTPVTKNTSKIGLPIDTFLNTFCGDVIYFILPYVFIIEC